MECYRVATGQEMVKEKFFKVRKVYSEAGKIDISKRSCKKKGILKELIYLFQRQKKFG